uniref:Uncharacterized protein n=1 Tax=Parascaris univalens TaxID=6257 RepID=A0A915AQJ3_PARUN
MAAAIHSQQNRSDTLHRSSKKDSVSERFCAYTTLILATSFSDSYIYICSCVLLCRCMLMFLGMCIFVHTFVFLSEPVLQLKWEATEARGTMFGECSSWSINFNRSDSSQTRRQLDHLRAAAREGILLDR